MQYLIMKKHPNYAEGYETYSNSAVWTIESGTSGITGGTVNAGMSINLTTEPIAENSFNSWYNLATNNIGAANNYIVTELDTARRRKLTNQRKYNILPFFGLR